MLDVGGKSGDSSLMISAASQVSLKLKSSVQSYADWLRETVGALPRLSTDVIDALRGSAFPILTTNYDTLIEGEHGRSASWRDPLAIQAVVAGESEAVGHLHGVWTEPDSIVLSDVDYTTHLLSKGVQALQQAASSIKALVYIGYGSGLEDPNFSKLLEWQRQTFGGTSHHHYRLCLSSELAALAKVHADDNIIVEAYGASHDMLPTYLADSLGETKSAALTRVGKIRDVVAEAKAEFEEAMKMHAVVLFPTASEPEGGAPIVPPPLLPVPYAKYVERRSDKKDPSVVVERLDAKEVAETLGVTVVASEEGGGLTTALRWLALRAADSSPGTTPVYLAFNQCSNRSTPVRSALKPQLRAQGFLDEAGDPLPPIVLALDDVHAYGKAAGTVLRELVELALPQVFIGCRVGDEDEILATLRAAGSHPTVRYVGRFETKEVTELLTVVAPGQVERLMERVVDAFVRTNLPRTPMTVASIVYILLHGVDSVISSTASQSSILEQYVSILLGQGNPLEDARVGIEAGGRVSVLASLAEHFVDHNTRVLPENAVIDRFAAHFARVGWKESETKLLEGFVRRGILRRTDGGIEFQHNSFVYLFAAKRAITHQEFLDQLLERPIYYGRIIQVHAGLARSDSTPLGKLITEYNDQLCNVGFDQGPAYAPVRARTPPANLESTDSDSQDSENDDAGRDNSAERSAELTALDYPEPLLPLFNDDVDLPLLAELARILELVSGVIRDADQIEDADLKRRALRVVLQGWGHFISAFSHSVSFTDLVETISSELEDEEETTLDAAERARIAAFLERILPVGAAMGGISFTLKSRTLLRPLEHEMANEDFDSPELIVAASLLLISLGERGWARQVLDLIRRSSNHSVWHDFFRFDFERCFMSADESDDDRAAALEGLVEIQARLFSFPSVHEANSFKDRFRADLRRKRLERETVGRITIGVTR